MGNASAKNFWYLGWYRASNNAEHSAYSARCIIGLKCKDALARSS